MSDGKPSHGLRRGGPLVRDTTPKPAVVGRRTQIRLLVLAASLGSLASLIGMGVAAEPRPAYATVKVASTFRTDRASAHLAFPDDLPGRGALIATGNALSPQATWIIVDLDARLLRRATTRLSASTSDGEKATVVERDVSRDLTTSEADAVILVANTIWTTRDPASIDAPGPTDAICSVALFDGNDVLHEFGAACPRAEFVQMLMALAEQSQ